MSNLGSHTWIPRLAAAVGLVAVMASTGAGVAGAATARAAGTVPATASILDWSQYLHGPQHSSLSQATAFTPSNSTSPSQVWHWQPPVIPHKPAAVLEASPTVVAGIVYIGAGSGGFYALNESTGALVWSKQLDTGPNTACLGRGIVATAAVVPDPITAASTVYVSGARFLYALKASTGAQVWKTEIGPANGTNYYNWSSPTVVGGHIYVGLSSRCDRPLIRGGVVELDQHTGQVLHTWYTVPAGSIGGSVWSSIATSTNGSDVWVSTGNECDPTINTCPAGNKIGNSLSIVHLSSSLKLLQAWQAPGTAGGGHDFDFGSSPTLFGSSGTPPDVGACNKNGKYYAARRQPARQFTSVDGPDRGTGRRRAERVPRQLGVGRGDRRPLRRRQRHHHRGHELWRLGPAGESEHRRLHLADRPPVRRDGHPEPRQRRRAGHRHLQLPQL